jgi:hypothetical protein
MKKNSGITVMELVISLLIIACLIAFVWLLIYHWSGIGPTIKVFLDKPVTQLKVYELLIILFTFLFWFK